MKLNYTKKHENAVAPAYATEGDAGLDLCAVEADVIPAGSRKLIQTGIAIELPSNTVAYVCSRSGLAIKKGVFVLNAPGVIDSGYRDGIGVILQNSGDEDFEIEAGDRIAQLVIQEFISVKPVEVEELSESARGLGGFGSTGVRSLVVEAEAVVVEAETVVFESEADAEAELIAAEEGDVVVVLPALVEDEADEADVEDEFSTTR